MQLYQRAFLIIRRNFFYYFIFMVAIISLSTLSLSTIILNQAFLYAEENFRNSSPAIITLQGDPLNSQSLFDFEKRDVFIENTILEIASLPHVDFFNYGHSNVVHSSSLFRNDPVASQLSGYESQSEFFFNPFSLRGTSNVELIYVREGLFNIESGRTFTTAEINKEVDFDLMPTIISEQLANYNDLSVGEVITVSLITAFADDPEHSKTIDYNLNIIGIFSHPNRQEVFFNPLLSLWQEAHENSIFVPNWVVIQVQNDYYTQSNSINRSIIPPVSATFVISDVNLVDDFLLSASRFLENGMHLDSYESRFAVVEHSINTLQYLMNYLYYGVLLASLIVLTLVNALMIYERRVEIGIYMALGSKRKSIILQFLIEVFAVSLISITISLFLGNVVANGLSRFILQNEVISFYENHDWYYSGNFFGNIFENSFGFHELTHTDIIEATEIGVSIDIVINYYIVYLSVLAFSTLVSIGQLLSLNPKKVLYELH